jgi:hypothetical protein
MSHPPFLIVSVTAYANWYGMAFFAPLEQYSVPVVYLDFRRMSF